MPAPLIIIGGIALLLSGLALIFWNKIFDIFSEHIMPFLRQHVPSLAPLIQEAFIKVDGAVAKIRRAAKEAWRRVREYIIHAEEVYERTEPGEYTATQTVYSTTEKPDEIREVKTSRHVNLDDLPPEVRAKIVQAQRPTTDILAARDQELEMAQ
jgi:hypothetical protein